ncbi:MAG: hypothetical protein U9R37_06875 [Campylobacterota bacterium]|nr:hypothetical protein [Campylobacterota bacterium]
MKKILKFLIYSLLFIFAFLYFLPKENLYYLLLENLKKEKIVVSNEYIKDTGFALELEGIDVKYQNISVVNTKDIDINSYFFVTNIDIRQTKLDGIMSSFVPDKISKLNIKYSIFNPTVVSIFSTFNLGSCSGEVDLINRVVNLDIKVSKKFKRKYRLVVNKLKLDKTRKDKNMEYYKYEYKF